jgi:histidinol-phosphate aminotransferase
MSRVMTTKIPLFQMHGGLRSDELAALGVDLTQVIDFSASLNVYGPDAAVAAAVRGADLLAYPDPTALPARRALARHHQVSEDAVVIGHGAVELLWSLARLVATNANTVVVEPAFGEWRSAVMSVGGRVAVWRATADRRFALDTEAVLRTVANHRATSLYLANPGNPSGLAIDHETIAGLARGLGERTMILDEAFLSLSDHHADAARPLPGNVVRVRSLTKDHGLAGLRVGYAVATPAFCRRLEAARPPWSASTPAIAAVVAACERDSFVADSRARLLADRDHLAIRLQELGLVGLASNTIYLLVRTGAATDLRSRLLSRHHVAVRDASSFGLPDYIRVAARPAADVDRLISALAVELKATPR